MFFHKTKPQKSSDNVPSQRLQELFDGVPGPSPWYLTPSLPTAKGFSWQAAGDKSPAVGKTLLMGKDGPVAVLNFQNYVKALDESTLLVWHQDSKRGVSYGPIDGPIHFLLLKPKLLTPFEGDLDSLYQEMNDRKDSIKLGGHASVEFELETTKVDVELTAEFPMQIRALDELLLFCRSSAIGSANGWSRANLALFVA